MLWLGSPLKLSCPMQMAAPVPSVFCSSPGMAVQMAGPEPNIQMLGVIGVLSSTDNVCIRNSLVEKMIIEM